MEFTGFVLGVRFAATQLSQMTPEKAFQILFDRVPAKYVIGAALHGAVDQGAESEPDPTYLCILSNLKLQQGKELYERMRNDPYICSFLTAYRPFVQNNYIERCKEGAFLGSVGEDGVVSGGESAYGTMRFCGKDNARPMSVQQGRYMLVAPAPIGNALPAADAARLLTRAAALAMPNVRILPLRIAAGGTGTVDALVTASSGRYITLKTDNIRCGILPDRTAVLETEALTKETVNAALSELLARGYASVILAAGNTVPNGPFPADMELTVLSDLPGERLKAENEHVAYRSGIETVLERSGFFRLCKDAFLVVTTSLLDSGDGRLLNAAADTVLYHCGKAGVDTALLMTDGAGRYDSKLGNGNAEPLLANTPGEAACALMERVKLIAKA